MLSMQITGDITYNGATFDEFIPQRTSSYIEQTDLHMPELTVRETMDFAARVQGVGHKAGQNFSQSRTLVHTSMLTPVNVTSQSSNLTLNAIHVDLLEDLMQRQCS